MLHRILFGLTFLILALACKSTSTPQNSSTPESADSPGTWTQIASADSSKPIKRHEAAFVKVNDQLVLLGGRRIQPVSRFGLRAKTWTQGSKPPLEIHHFQPVVYKDKVYIMGAFTGGYPDESPVPLIYIYDPATDLWSTGDSIPADRLRGAAGVVFHKGSMYLVSGIQRGHMSGHVPWLDKYDPATGKWEKLADAPRSRDHFQAIVVENKLYLLGGRRSNAPNAVFANAVAEVDVYDFASGKWSTLPEPLPTLRAGNYVTKMKDEILVLGGESEFQPSAHNEVEALNVHSHQWRSLAPMLRGRHGTGA
ncbi:MAG: kelch repeat-containing protein, partial [Bacteroidota bacterium]